MCFYPNVFGYLCQVSHIGVFHFVRLFLCSHTFLMISSEEELSESEESCEELEPRPNLSKTASSKEMDTSSSDDSDASETTSCMKENPKKFTADADSSDESEHSDSAPAIKQESRSHQVSSSASSGSESDSENIETNKVPVASDSNSESGSSSPSTCSKQSTNEHVDVKTEADSSHTQARSKKSRLFSQSVRRDSSLSNSSESSKEDTNKMARSADENVDDPENMESSIPGNMLSFSKKNLIKYSSGIIDVENLSISNDLWLIHCPKMLSEVDLHGISLNFNSGVHLRIGKRKFQTVLYPENGTVACVLPSKTVKEYLVVGLPVKGSVVVEESVKLPKPVQLEFTSNDGVQFPTNLKVRHPLFGSDYKRRLSNSLESKLRSKSSEKKKSKKQRLSIGYERITPSVDLPSIKTEKSSKKHKNRDSVNDSYSSKERSQSERRESMPEKNYGVNGDCSSENPKKRKRGKSEDDSRFNEFLEPSKTKRRKFDTSDGPATPSAKKCKRNDPEEDFLKIIENIKEEVLSACETTFDEGKTNEKKKKKKKKEKERTKIGL